MSKKITYIAPVFVDLAYISTVSGACSPFGSQDNAGDCSTGKISSNVSGK